MSLVFGVNGAIVNAQMKGGGGCTKREVVKHGSEKEGDKKKNNTKGGTWRWGAIVVDCSPSSETNEKFVDFDRASAPDSRKRFAVLCVCFFFFFLLANYFAFFFRHSRCTTRIPRGRVRAGSEIRFYEHSYLFIKAKNKYYE